MGVPAQQSASAGTAQPSLLAYLDGRLVDIPATAGRCGVYLLLDGNEVVYVGQSLDVDARIAVHRHNAVARTTRKRKRDRSCDRPIAFDGARYLPVPEADLDAFEGALIRAFRPKHNRAAPRDTESDEAVLVALGLPPHDARSAHREVLSHRAKMRWSPPVVRRMSR